jgi:hypothetical protein
MVGRGIQRVRGDRLKTHRVDRQAEFPVPVTDQQVFKVNAEIIVSHVFCFRFAVFVFDRVNSLCKKTPTTALFSFLKQSFTNSKLLSFKNFESLVYDAFLSKTENNLVFFQALNIQIISRQSTMHIWFPAMQDAALCCHTSQRINQ